VKYIHCVTGADISFLSGISFVNTPYAE
jgi:hypothetical protein